MPHPIPSNKSENIYLYNMEVRTDQEEMVGEGLKAGTDGNMRMKMHCV